MCKIKEVKIGQNWKIDTAGKKRNEEYNLSGLEKGRAYISLCNLYIFVYLDNSDWYGSIAWQMDSNILLNSIWNKPGTTTQYQFFAQCYTSSAAQPAGVQLYNVTAATAIWSTTAVTSTLLQNTILSTIITIPADVIIQARFKSSSGVGNRCYIGKAGIFIINTI